MLLRRPRALFSVPLPPVPRALLGASAGPDTDRRMAAASVVVTERRRVPPLEVRCCRAARRAAASAGDSRADRGPRGMLLLSVGERCCVLGRAVRLPLGALRCAAGPGGEGEGAGMRLPAPCGRLRGLRGTHMLVTGVQQVGHHGSQSDVPPEAEGIAATAPPTCESRRPGAVLMLALSCCWLEAAWLLRTPPASDRRGTPGWPPAAGTAAPGLGGGGPRLLSGRGGLSVAICCTTSASSSAASASLPACAAAAASRSARSAGLQSWAGLPTSLSLASTSQLVELPGEARRALRGVAPLRADSGVRFSSLSARCSWARLRRAMGGRRLAAPLLDPDRRRPSSLPPLPPPRGRRET